MGVIFYLLWRAGGLRPPPSALLRANFLFFEKKICWHFWFLWSFWNFRFLSFFQKFCGFENFVFFWKIFFEIFWFFFLKVFEISKITNFSKIWYLDKQTNGSHVKKRDGGGGAVLFAVWKFSFFSSFFFWFFWLGTCSIQLEIGNEENCEVVGGGAVLSTFYVLIKVTF